MSRHVVLSELKRIGDAEAGKPYSCRAHLDDADIQRWSHLIDEPRSALYDELAVYLARGFHGRELEFEFCDAIMNDIFGLIISAEGELMPELFYRIYCAFDEGEFYHGDNRQEDPVEAYTRPQIADIVENLPAA
jgi:hypothetical protein